MRMSLSDLIERVGSSLWLAPALALFLSLAAAALLQRIDEAVPLPLLHEAVTDNPETARSVLGVVATGMMSFMGLVFSITMVVLQLAASQYSPRIIRTFLRDWRTKGTLSLFVGTFAFSLLVLRTVDSDGRHVVPALGIAVTFVLVFASLLAFVAYLHHMAQAVRVSYVMRRIAEEAVAVIERLPRTPSFDEDDLWESWEVGQVVAWHGEPGVLTHVAEPRLVAFAAKHDVILRMRFSIGDFVPTGSLLFEVRGGREEVSGARLCTLVSLGLERTPQQDIAAPMRQLVDVALRALSPSVNDPTTAVQALDALHDLLRRLTSRSLPSPVLRDERGHIRVVIPRMTWQGYLRLAITEIRLASGSKVQVSRRILCLLDDLWELASPDRRLALERERRLLLAALDEGLSREDRELATCGDPQGIGARPLRVPPTQLPSGLARGAPGGA